MIQVLFSFSWDEILRTVSWIEDEGIKSRIMTDDGRFFERWSTSCTLTEEWAMESIYVFYRPAVVPSLGIAFILLGSFVDVLDHLPRGPLAPPIRCSIAGRR